MNIASTLDGRLKSLIQKRLWRNYLLHVMKKKFREGLLGPRPCYNKSYVIDTKYNRSNSCVVELYQNLDSRNYHHGRKRFTYSTHRTELPHLIYTIRQTSKNIQFGYLDELSSKGGIRSKILQRFYNFWLGGPGLMKRKVGPPKRNQTQYRLVALEVCHLLQNNDSAIPKRKGCWKREGRKRSSLHL